MPSDILKKADKIQQINNLHSLALKSANQSLFYAFRIGALLSRIKDEIEHGSFENMWYSGGFSFGLRQAQRYMRCFRIIHKQYPQIESDEDIPNIISTLSVNNLSTFLDENAKVKKAPAQAAPLAPAMPRQTHPRRERTLREWTHVAAPVEIFIRDLAPCLTRQDREELAEQLTARAVRIWWNRWGNAWRKRRMLRLPDL